MSLRRFILKRVLLVFPILLGVSIVTFSLVKLTPGNPVQVAIGLNPDMGPQEIARLKQRYGLTQPAWKQYLNWLGDIVLHGDFGSTYGARERAVSDIIANRLPETVVLGLFGWVFALAIAIPTGIYAAVRKDELGDHVSRFVALAGISLPNFWLGLMLILVFALVLNLFPVSAPRKPLWHPATLWYLLLPGITIGTASASNLMRIMRSSMAEEMNKEYVTAARAKGLPERTVVLKHVLRNSLISVTTVAAFLTAAIVSGSVVVEQVFGWPGLGRELIAAVRNRQVDLILGITLFTGVAIILANLLADILYAVLDPRIRYD
ncbi:MULTISPECIES: ABC transporter permease [Haloarcula]|uniref:ABC transporter permease n=1 Tax=Haloarcula pellucida TaxID=1427151 RepID=A0A830GMC3_9EURY|nr:MULTISPECIES: ABC transporter permease [Halomicroarcula]MBX0348435.1 ABC transporter permease [Halomicroarcula pellucida]MDS0278259.1 ABC transporter permease [Halomicroarcula sp. S1AR25-4]QIO23903.1 ABC transporter permease [Haloarcula sp. JP-L23]GGN93360.1 ABC transporter permease [Halomicroarcula pellucida]